MILDRRSRPDEPPRTFVECLVMEIASAREDSSPSPSEDEDEDGSSSYHFLYLLVNFDACNKSNTYVGRADSAGDVLISLWDRINSLKGMKTPRGGRGSASPEEGKNKKPRIGAATNRNPTRMDSALLENQDNTWDLEMILGPMSEEKSVSGLEQWKGKKHGAKNRREFGIELARNTLNVPCFDRLKDETDTVNIHVLSRCLERGIVR